MKKRPEGILFVRAACPTCRKISDFKVRTVAEIKAFPFRPHDCPNLYCRKRGLTGWIVRQY